MKDRREAVMMHATTPTGARAPVVEIGPGKSFMLDLLFPLPAGLSNASELPAFDVISTVGVGARAVTARTSFERQ